MYMNQCKEDVGIVTEDEKNEVMCLYERIMGLKEMLPALEIKERTGENDENLYDRIIHDLGSTKRKQDEWWIRMSNKYQWKMKTGAHWQINFEDNKIYLQDASV